MEEIREMAEAEILSSMNLIGRFSDVIVKLCGTAYREKKSGEEVCTQLPPNVREVAVLALCKLMATSGEFCEPNLRLLFTILKKDPSPQIRANIIIALGDLFFRFPNMLEPWSSHFFDRLTDHDLTVRKHTLMALTHLILNDMVKVRAQVSDIAMCLEDEEPRMQDHHLDEHVWTGAVLLIPFCKYDADGDVAAALTDRGATTPTCWGARRRRGLV